MKYVTTTLLRNLALLFAGVLLASCSDAITPVMPVWDVNLNVPFSARSYTIEDLLAQDPTVQAVPTGSDLLKAAVKNGLITDTVTVRLSEKNISELLKVNDGILVCELENRLPAGVTVQAEFLDAMHQTLVVPKTAGGDPIQISPANIGADGRASSLVTTRTEFLLSDTDIRSIARSAFVRLRLNVSTPGTTPVLFATADFVKIRMYASVIVRSDFSTP